MPNTNLMTIESLIEFLQEFPKDTIINLGVQSADTGKFTYVGLTEANIDYRPSLKALDLVIY